MMAEIDVEESDVIVKGGGSPPRADTAGGAPSPSADGATRPKGATRFQRMTQADDPTPDGPLTRVTINAGRHAGATATLDTQRFSVGSDLGCDVILTDHDLAPVHAIVTRTSSMFSERVTIEAVGDDVSCNGEAIVAGTRHDSALPVRLRLGETEMSLATMGGGARPGGATSSGWMWLLIPAAIGVGLLLGWVLSSLEPASRTAAFQRGPVEARPQASGASRPTEVAASQEVRGYEARLEEAGLGQSIAVVERGRAVIFRGSVNQSDHETWRTVKRAIQDDGLDPSRMVDLVSVNAPARVSPNLVGAVTMRPVPTVIGGDGRRAKVGEMLSDGWMVEAIGDGKVTLKRGQQTVTVPF